MLDVLFASQRDLSEELELSFRTLCAIPAPARLLLPPSQAAGQTTRVYSMGAFLLVFSILLATSRCGAEATLLPHSWQEKASLSKAVGLDSDCPEEMEVIVPCCSYHSHMSPVPEERSSRTGGWLNLTSNSPKLNTTGSIQKAAAQASCDVRPVLKLLKATLKCKAPPEATRKRELNGLQQVLLQTDCWLARSPWTGAQRCL